MFACKDYADVQSRTVDCARMNIRALSKNPPPCEVGCGALRKDMKWTPHPSCFCHSWRLVYFELVRLGGGALRVGTKTWNGLHTHLVFVTLGAWYILSVYRACLTRRRGGTLAPPRSVFMPLGEYSSPSGYTPCRPPPSILLSNVTWRHLPFLVPGSRLRKVHGT